MTFYRSKIHAKTWNGSDLRIFHHSSIQSCFGTDRKYLSILKVWITEENTADFLGVDFCLLFLKPNYFDIPEVELRLEEGVIFYGLMNNDKKYRNVSINCLNYIEKAHFPSSSLNIFVQTLSGTNIKFPISTSKKYI